MMMKKVSPEHKLLNNDIKLEWSPFCRFNIMPDGGGIIVSSERDWVMFKGKLFPHLAPLLQGLYSAEELADQLEHVAPQVETYYALLKLEEKYYIQSTKHSLSNMSRALCQQMKINDNVAASRLSTHSVYIFNTSKEARPYLEEACRFLDLIVESKPECADILIQCVDDYLDSAFLSIDHKKPWVLAKPYGSILWLGPVFQGEHKNCLPCFLNQIKKNRFQENFNIPKPLSSLEDVSNTLHLKLGLELIALELFKWIVTGSHPIEDKLLTFDLLNLDHQCHYVPSATLCLHQESPTPINRRIVLQSRKKKEGERNCSPQETFVKYQHLISPISGLVHSITPAQEKIGSTTHVYRSGANYAINKTNKSDLLRSFRHYSAGKGITQSAAQAGALCEILERMSGIVRGTEPKVEATWHEIKKEAIHPHLLSNYSHFQYENRLAMNEKAHSFSKIGAPFIENEPIAWTPVWSLSENCTKYVPLSYCYYGYQGKYQEWVYSADSNGCAAGNCLEEAILQAFFELVERDCIAIWWYNRLLYPQVDLQQFSHPYIHDFVAQYSEYGREVHLLNLTNDLNIPTFAAVSRCLEGFEKIIFGFGTHLDAETAIMRALTELNQIVCFPKFWERQPDEDDPQDQIDLAIIRQWMEFSTYANQPFLQGTIPVKNFLFPKWKTDDLLKDLEYCMQIIKDHGFEMLVLDQTRKDIGLNVVRVIVPPLRHFWKRFGPGRLYDVPLKMGKLKVPLEEHQLNPIPMFI